MVRVSVLEIHAVPMSVRNARTPPATGVVGAEYVYLVESSRRFTCLESSVAWNVKEPPLYNSLRLHAPTV